MRWKGKKYSLTPAGYAVLISLLLFLGLLVYIINQPKQVQYIYESVRGFFIGEIKVPEQPKIPR